MLGEVGSNFGAGMTGGLAWVYDADGSFLRDMRYHPDFVTPESFSQVDPQAQAELHLLIEQHVAESASSLAQAILRNWDEAAAAFVWLTPKPQV